MPTFIHTAEDVINAVIQDGQVLTTNRAALLDYVNRTSLRILRESQWSFLQSTTQKFITSSGIDRYWVGSGNAPAGCSNSNLGLSDFESILPESVYDLTNAVSLSQVATQPRYTFPFLQKDGQLRLGQPRGYGQYINEPNIVHLFPPPDSENNYQPIPSPSVCTSLPGGVLPGRTYYFQTTYVDSMGGESVASITFPLSISPGFLAVVESPAMEVPSALSTTYSFWNVYVSPSAQGPFYRQNLASLSVGSSWTEPSSGLTDFLGVPSAFNLGNALLGIAPSGEYFTTTSPGSSVPILLQASDSSTWQVYALSNGQLMSSLTIPGGAVPLLVSDSAENAWLLGVTTGGQLTTTFKGSASQYGQPTSEPPSNSTIAALEGYVIAFRYQKKRIAITQVTQTLQVPDDYFDVVVAGVNYYANLYTAKGDDENFKAPVWKREFMEGLAQIRRDLRTNYRNTDFISPDRSTQQDQFRSLYGYYF